MKEYEVFCEYYDTCSPKPRTSMEEIEITDIESYMEQFISKNDTVTRSVNANNDVVYEVAFGGIRKRYTFTQI